MEAVCDLAEAVSNLAGAADVWGRVDSKLVASATGEQSESGILTSIKQITLKLCKEAESLLEPSKEVAARHRSKR